MRKGLPRRPGLGPPPVTLRPASIPAYADTPPPLPEIGPSRPMLEGSLRWVNPLR